MNCVSESTANPSPSSGGGYKNSQTRYHIFAGDVMQGIGVDLLQKSSFDHMRQNANELKRWLVSQDGSNSGWVEVDV
jgi:hypothetical protein